MFESNKARGEKKCLLITQIPANPLHTLSAANFFVNLFMLHLSVVVVLDQSLD